jgi:hypothetical protein
MTKRVTLVGHPDHVERRQARNICPASPQSRNARGEWRLEREVGEDRQVI